MRLSLSSLQPICSTSPLQFLLHNRNEQFGPDAGAVPNGHVDQPNVTITLGEERNCTLAICDFSGGLLAEPSGSDLADRGQELPIDREAIETWKVKVAAAKLAEAAAVVAKEPVAIQLRYLQTLTEIRGGKKYDGYLSCAHRYFSRIFQAIVGER